MGGGRGGGVSRKIKIKQRKEILLPCLYLPVMTCVFSENRSTYCMIRRVESSTVHDPEGQHRSTATSSITGALSAPGTMHSPNHDKYPVSNLYKVPTLRPLQVPSLQTTARYPLSGHYKVPTLRPLQGTQSPNHYKVPTLRPLQGTHSPNHYKVPTLRPLQGTHSPNHCKVPTLRPLQGTQSPNHCKVPTLRPLQGTHSLTTAKHPLSNHYKVPTLQPLKGTRSPTTTRYPLSNHYKVPTLQPLRSIQAAGHCAVRVITITIAGFSVLVTFSIWSKSWVAIKTLSCNDPTSRLLFSRHYLYLWLRARHQDTVLFALV